MVTIGGCRRCPSKMSELGYLCFHDWEKKKGFKPIYVCLLKRQKHTLEFPSLLFSNPPIRVMACLTILEKKGKLCNKTLLSGTQWGMFIKMYSSTNSEDRKFLITFNTALIFTDWQLFGILVTIN